MLDVSKILWAQQGDAVFSDSALNADRTFDFSTVNNVRSTNSGPTPVPFYASVFGLTVYEGASSIANFNMTPRGQNLSEKEIPFQYIEGVPNWSKGANYQDTNDILGRYEGFAVYSNSNSQETTITLHYHAERETGYGWSLENIEKIEKYLQSLVYPTTNIKYAPPPRMLLNIGYLWRNVPVIIRNVNIEFIGPFMADGFRAHQRKITLELKTNYDLGRSMSRDEIISNASGTSRYEIFAARKINTRG